MGPARDVGLPHLAAVGECAACAAQPAARADDRRMAGAGGVHAGVPHVLRRAVRQRGTTQGGGVSVPQAALSRNAPSLDRRSLWRRGGALGVLAAACVLVSFAPTLPPALHDPA